MRRNFGIIVGIVVIVVAIAALVAYFATHLTGTNQPATTYGTTNSPSSSSSKTSQPSSNSTQSTAAILQTKTSSSLGSYLATADGKPLYTYGGDMQGTSNCNDGCIASWPAYAATKTTDLPANVSVITRSDGSKQYAYKGLPLYTFAGDTSTQPTGDGVSNFHLAKP